MTEDTIWGWVGVIGITMFWVVVGAFVGLIFGWVGVIIALLVLIVLSLNA